MSECGVCLFSDASDCEGMIDDASIVVLDNDQRCSECGLVVLAGAPIEEATWYEDDDEDEEPGEPEDKTPIYTCVVCAEIADAFYCEGDGRMYGGGLWDSMYQVMGELNSSCFDRLSSPEAKAYLRQRWMKWKGISE